MNRTIKKLLITGASLFMFTGLTGINSAHHSVHASMPDPEYYYSTRQRHNVYYGIGNSKWGEKVNYLLYGKMPKPMQKRGHIFALYHGRLFNKEVGGYHDSLDRTLYRNDQTYWPDYVGYTVESKHDDGSDAQNRVNYRGHKGYIEVIYINKKDIAKPVKNQNSTWIQTHAYLKSVRYVPAGHYRARTTHRYAYHHARKAKRYVKKLKAKANRYGYYKRGVYHRYKTGYYHQGHWVKYRKAKVTRQKVRKTRRQIKRHHRAKVVNKPAINQQLAQDNETSQIDQLVATDQQPVQDNESGQANQPTAINQQPDQGNEPSQSNQPTQPQSNPYWNQNGYPTDQALGEASNDLIDDINNDRAEYGISALNPSNNLNQIAGQRSGQLFSDGFTHYDSNGNMYLTDDANNDGISLGNTWAENIGYTDGYTNQTPQQIADTFNTMLFTNEKGATPDQDGGHRKNILNPAYTQVGVGMMTDGKGTTNIAEDFSD